MEENATLVELADIAFEWMETAIPAEAPSAPSSPEELPQSPTCSGSFTTTDTESSQSSEWEEAPKKAPRLSPSSRSSKTTSVAAAAPKATRGRGRKARIRPEERLLRKKEQNKTAATRYRYSHIHISWELSRILIQICADFDVVRRRRWNWVSPTSNRWNWRIKTGNWNGSTTPWCRNCASWRNSPVMSSASHPFPNDQPSNRKVLIY